MVPGLIGELNEIHSSDGKNVEWYIPQFSSLLRSGKLFHRSSCFNFANAPWHLQLYAGTMVNGYLSVYLQNDSGRPCHVSYMFGLKDINCMLVGPKAVTDISIAHNKGIPDFFSLSSLEEREQFLTPSNTLKIVCNLKLSHTKMAIGVVGQLYQHGELSEKRVEWHIPHFSSLFRDGRPFFSSPSFNVVSTFCHLEIHLGTILSGLLSLFLCNESRCPRQVTLSFSLRDVNGRLIESKGGNNIELKENWGFQDYTNLNSLYQSPYHVVPSDKLIIICDVVQSDDPEISIIPENSTMYGKDQYSERITFTETETLSKNLRNFFNSEDRWDTLLKVQEKEFKVHRAILIARSPVFAAMFHHDTIENQTGIITISDCDPGAFKKFLEYLYSGKLEDISFNDAYYLYSISDKYDEPQVKKFCSKYMRQNFSVENFCDVVMLADTYDDTRLLATAQQFFNKNLTAILVTDDWKTFLQNNINLGNKFFIEMTKSK